MSPLGRLGRAVVLLSAMLGLYWLTPVGGQMTYVLPSGVSMEPKYREGDLVVVRRSAGPHPVGSVVAYHNADLGTVVLHRVVGQNGGRYVTQGDANSWVDSDQPVDQQVIGRPWLRVPFAGRLLGALRTPAVAALVAGVLVLGTSGAASLRFGRSAAPSRS